MTQATVVGIEAQAHSRVIEVSQRLVGAGVEKPLGFGHAGDVAILTEVAFVVAAVKEAAAAATAPDGVITGVAGGVVVVHADTGQSLLLWMLVGRKLLLLLVEL